MVWAARDRFGYPVTLELCLQSLGGSWWICWGE